MKFYICQCNNFLSIKSLFMKKVLLVTLITTIGYYADAQLIKRMADRAKNKVEQKAGEKIDKGIDDAPDGKKKEKKKNGSDTNSEEADQGSSSNKKTSSTDGSSRDDEENQFVDRLRFKG